MLLCRLRPNHLAETCVRERGGALAEPRHVFPQPPEPRSAGLAAAHTSQLYPVHRDMFGNQCAVLKIAAIYPAASRLPSNIYLLCTLFRSDQFAVPLSTRHKVSYACDLWAEGTVAGDGRLFVQYICSQMQKMMPVNLEGRVHKLLGNQN